MENVAQVHFVIAVFIISLLGMAQSQYYYSSSNYPNNGYEKIVEHITPVSNFFPAVQVYSNPYDSYGYPTGHYRNAPETETGGCEKRTRQSRGLYPSPYPVQQANYYDSPNGWYQMYPGGYPVNNQSPMMRSSQNPQPMMRQSNPAEQQFYNHPNEQEARNSRTFNSFRDLLPGLFSSDREQPPPDVPYHSPQVYNNEPNNPPSMQTYY